MRRIKRAKPSPALIVAVVALVAGVAGTAVGGVAITSLNKKDKKQVRKISKKQANKRINKREASLNVKSARSAETAASADDAETLDGFDANSLVRVAGVTVDSPDETEAEIASTAITAPTDGQLMIVASVDSGSIGATTDGFDCLIKLDEDPTEHGLRSVRVTGPENDEENCATNVLVPVEAGPHTVRFEGNSVNAAAVSFSSADMQVLFVPFDGSGN